MYTEYLRTEDRAEYERPAEPPRRPPQRRRRRDPRFAALALLVLFLAGFVSGCCVGRAHAAGKADTGSTPGGGTAQSLFEKSNIPDSITLPDYVEEYLLPVNEYSRCGDKLTRVNAIVIHYVGNPSTTAWQNRSYFENLATSGETSASSNLIVGMEGEALLCVPLDEVAYCSNKRNSDTISIEFCHPDAEGKPTDATYDTLVKLTAWLCEVFGLDAETDVIRHYDVIGKECPLYYVQNEDAWTQFKTDVTKAMK